MAPTNETCPFAVETTAFEATLKKLESDHVVGDAAGITPTLTVADPREWRG